MVSDLINMHWTFEATLSLYSMYFIQSQNYILYHNIFLQPPTRILDIKIAESVCNCIDGI